MTEDKYLLAQRLIDSWDEWKAMSGAAMELTKEAEKLARTDTPKELIEAKEIVAETASEQAAAAEQDYNEARDRFNEAMHPPSVIVLPELEAHEKP